MGAEPSDLPDLTGIDLTPTWDEPDPALLDDALLEDALLEPDVAGFEPLDDLGAAEAFGEGFDFAG